MTTGVERGINEFPRGLLGCSELVTTKEGELSQVLAVTAGSSVVGILSMDDLEHTALYSQNWLMGATFGGLDYWKTLCREGARIMTLSCKRLVRLPVDSYGSRVQLISNLMLFILNLQGIAVFKEILISPRKSEVA